MLYVVNVEACIHQENYGIFFYEPAAKQKIELFEAKWTFESLTDAFSQIAAHINRREFEDNDYQVIVCVRKHKRASRHQVNAQRIWHDTTLYAKTLTARALEQSGMTSVLTSSYTRKLKIVFQSEQEYFGSAQQISSWEEEQEGLRSFLGSLQAACETIQNDQSDHENISGEKNSYVMVDSFGLPSVLTPKEWENTLFQALTLAVLHAKKESSQTWLQRRILSVMEEEKLLDEKMRMPEEELPQIDNINSPDEISDENYGEYISHRLRSVIEGSQIGRVCEVIYWPVAANSSQASTLAMFGLVELLCTQKEITQESIQRYLTQGDPRAAKQLQEHFFTVLEGYRYQLIKKRQQIIREIQSERADLYASNDKDTSFEQEQRVHIEPLMVPSAPQEYQEHLKNVKMQLDICELSLKEGKKSEMKERIEQASDIIFRATDGLEDELVAYQKEAAKTLYREIEQSASIGFESVSSVNKPSKASIQTKKIQ